ncbi:MAG TPA: glycine cleavage system protein GcvH [Peptococcaceae bacterium]|jgi:glycine cleavage system H protein|nr:glycine cleavage system protein GcvH [Clostridia bacterium]HOB81753.1 glycine cleavage system protein GcvH [Peptococcaceae bacterium]HPZ71672.1 glycine cleavage system protein GcvH [Peptococcaceae bacterium]HQD53658.1 glycine cleavage system protein GcvH [Peptococcaceae bacterium]
MNYPEELSYTREHEWIRVEGKKGIIGITDYAQDSLGDVVFVELPEVGRKLKIGEVFGVVESVKAVSDIYSPCSGVVRAVNEKLLDHPEILNQDPYGEGWLIEVEMEELDSELLSSIEYADFAAGEE